MIDTDGSRQPLASVLVIAVDPNIESLAAELVAFAGHRPIFDATAGAAGESVRRTRPDIALLDTALPRGHLRACLNAADETRSRVVLMSSTASHDELVSDAIAEQCLHFELPGGPRQLKSVLDRALELKRRQERLSTRIPRFSTRLQVPGSIHPALCAALATVAQSRALCERVNAARHDNAVLREIRRDLLGDTQRSRASVRAAVADYAALLQQARIPEREALLQVQESIAECAAIVGADADVGSLLMDAEDWVAEVYRAA